MATKTKNRSAARRSRYTAATADRHELYQLSVQNVEAEIDFIDETFKELRGRRAARLREDFCGTGNTSCEWVRRRRTNVAVGLDIDQPTLDWGVEHNVSVLAPAARERVRLLNRNVLSPGREGSKMDVVLAMNFSYWIFQERELMRRYFKSVRRSLVDGGIFFLDFYGGSDAMSEERDERDIDGKFSYVWDQNRYNPITGEMTCYIHFHFNDGSKMRKAFSYTWRLWTLPEVREMLSEAGFRAVTVYWEQEDEEGEGNGEYEPTEVGTADPAFVCYIVAEK